MKKDVMNRVMCLQPFPHTIVSCRDKDGKDNALVNGFVANISFDPVMVMVGIIPSRYSHHIVKETGCFVINLPVKSYKKEYDYLGSHSGRDEDKFVAQSIKTTNATYIDAPLLADCPINIECSVVDSILPGTHELFLGKVEAVHCDEKYLDNKGNIQWNKIDLI
ncbi:MAG: flavin reductase family protein [Clostridium butyricum]|nr:flavin reductase family protein [Clostridium butyricum]